jgi:hypothetical protein
LKHLESALSEVLPIKSNLYSVRVQNKADHGLSSQRIIFVYSVYLDVILNLFEEGVGLVGVEDFVAVHDGHEVFGVAEVDDIMGVAWEHVDGLDMVTIYFPLEDFAVGVIEVTLLDEAMTFDDDELLPFGMVPMLTFGDAGLADVDADLSIVEGMNQLCKTAAVIDVHLQWEGCLLVGKVAEVGAVELLGEAASRNLGDKRTSPLLRVEC